MTCSSAAARCGEDVIPEPNKQVSCALPLAQSVLFFVTEFELLKFGRLQPVIAILSKHKCERPLLSALESLA
jgi:hypothetical protein